jgi:DNA-binding CsgD family transcriptional regulator
MPLAEMNALLARYTDLFDLAPVSYFPAPIPESSPSSSSNLNDRISQREYQVLRLVVEGNSTKEIAWLLKINSKTVDMHRINMMKKLQITSVVDLVKFAVREGIIDLV